MSDINNSLTNFTQNLATSTSMSPTINTLQTTALNNRYGLIFNNRVLLNELYVEHGIIQRLIDMPVDDAFRAGFDLDIPDVSEEEIQRVLAEIEKDGTIDKIAQVVKWGRLFGGGGLVIRTNQPNNKPLDITKINKFTELDFFPADLWELNKKYYSSNPNEEIDEERPYNFYGVQLHKSRVLPFKGKEPPSMLRPRMRGWGMTEVERVIRSFNSYLKNHNVIFELLDEAKIDVFKIKNFNSSLLTKNGSDALTKRVEMANQLKSFLNSLTMDVDDDFQQKQIQFGGLSDMLKEIRMGIAADLKMPMTKLFGISASGFNSGEDDIENYNSMVEHEVRSKTKPIIIQVVKMYFQKMYNYIPESISVEFPALRMLSAEQEQNVKSSEFNRVMVAYTNGLITLEDAQRMLNIGGLLPVDVDVNPDIQAPAVMDAEFTAGNISVEK